MEPEGLENGRSDSRNGERIDGNRNDGNGRPANRTGGVNDGDNGGGGESGDSGEHTGDSSGGDTESSGGDRGGNRKRGSLPKDLLRRIDVNRIITITEQQDRDGANVAGTVVNASIGTRGDVSRSSDSGERRDAGDGDAGDSAGRDGRSEPGNAESVTVGRIPVNPEKVGEVAKTVSRRGRGPMVDPETCGYMVSAIFGVVATARGPVGQWERSPAECEPAAIPLSGLIDKLIEKLPKKAKGNIDTLILALAFVAGMYAIASPSLAREKEFIARLRQRKQEIEFNVNGNESQNTTANTNVASANGIDGGSFGIGEDVGNYDRGSVQNPALPDTFFGG